MTSKYDFSSKLDQIATYVKDIGDVIEEYDVDDLFTITFNNDEYSVRGHRCDSGDNIYLVFGHPEIRPMAVVYFLSVTQNTGARIETDTAESILDDLPDSDHELKETAAERLLDDVDSAEMDALINYTYMFIAGPTHDTQIYTNDEGSLTGFNVSKMIFPYEDDFGIREFSDSVKTVIGAGERGSRLLSRSIFVSHDQEDPSNTELEINFGW